MLSILAEYVTHLLGYFNNITYLELVTNSVNGAAGQVVDEIQREFEELQVPIEFIKVHQQAALRFPNGIPNSLLPETEAQLWKL